MWRAESPSSLRERTCAQVLKLKPLQPLFSWAVARNAPVACERCASPAQTWRSASALARRRRLTSTADEPSAGNLGNRTSARATGQPRLQLEPRARCRRGSAARSPCRSGTWCSSNSRSTRSRAGDGSLCATTGSAAMSSIVTWRRPASACDGGTSSTSSSLPTGTSSSPSSGRVKRQRAEVEAPLLHLDRDLRARARGGRRSRCRDSAGGTAQSAAAACGRPPRWRR